VQVGCEIRLAPPGRHLGNGFCNRLFSFSFLSLTGRVPAGRRSFAPLRFFDRGPLFALDGLSAYSNPPPVAIQEKEPSGRAASSPPRNGWKASRVRSGDRFLRGGSPVARFNMIIRERQWFGSSRLQTAGGPHVQVRLD
jgi:hypothetical protein